MREIEQGGSTGFKVVDEFPGLFAETEQGQGIIGEKKRDLVARIEQGRALGHDGAGKAEHIQRGRHDINETCGGRDVDRVGDDAGTGEQEGDLHVFFVNLERMPVVAGMLAERFAVIAVNDKKRVGPEAAQGQAIEEIAQSLVAPPEGIEVTALFAGIVERTSGRSVIGMMPGDRQINEEEALTDRKRVQPGQHCGDCRGLVHADRIAGPSRPHSKGQAQNRNDAQRVGPTLSYLAASWSRGRCVSE